MSKIVNKNFSEIRKNQKENYSNFPVVKIALLLDTSSQFLRDILRGLAYDFKIDLEIYEGEFNSIDQEILDTNSKLYKFKPDYIFISFSVKNVENFFLKTSETKRKSEIKDFKENRISLIKYLLDNSDSKVFLSNLIEESIKIDSSITTNEFGFDKAVRDINNEIFKTVEANNNLSLINFNDIALDLGLLNIYSERNYYLTSNPYSNDFLISVSKKILNLIDTQRGNIIKLIVLDLDNTLYGGVVGDLGVLNVEIGSSGFGKSFLDFQIYLKELHNRGIALAVVSKNDEEIAKKVFTDNENMYLKLEDFSIFKANWEPKSQNIIEIKETLNIGYSSIIFIDDNPFERNEVKEALPLVNVLDLPEDKTKYLSSLKQYDLFSSLPKTKEDKLRLKQYKNEGKRNEIKTKTNSLDEYLKKLNMVATITEINEDSISRVSQLSLRTNQFNLRTIRYSENDIKKIIKDKNFFTFTIALKDKFDDLGIIAFVILEKKNNKMFIDSLVLSCRAAKRGVEEVMFNEILKIACEEEIKKIEAEYIKTEKNAPIDKTLDYLGFSFKKTKNDIKYYELDLFKITKKDHKIKIKGREKK